MDQADGERCDHFLGIQRAEDLLKLLHPGFGSDFGTSDLFSRLGDLRRLIDIVQAEFNGIYNDSFVENLLGRI